QVSPSHCRIFLGAYPTLSSGTITGRIPTITGIQKANLKNRLAVVFCFFCEIVIKVINEAIYSKTLHCLKRGFGCCVVPLAKVDLCGQGQCSAFGCTS